jgi:hypothetical protein
MGLKEVLEKMKLVELEEGEALPPPPAGAPAHPMSARPAAPAAPARTGAPMQDVLKKMPAAPKIDEAALEKAPKGEGSLPDFESVYKAAGVKAPAHGFSAYKVLEFLSSPDLAALDPRAKAAALSGFLKMNPTGPVPLSDIIQDAVARDQALDGFEEFLKKKLDTRRDELDKDSARLQAEIDEVTRRNKEKMDANRRTLEEEKERFATWQARKRIEERKLFDAVAPFVENNPVTLGAGASAGAGPAPESPAKPREGA